MNRPHFPSRRGASLFLLPSLAALMMSGAAGAGGDPEGKANLAGASKLPAGPGLAATFKADVGMKEHPAVSKNQIP